ncbi:MAG: uroporphyrinogen-III synthase, partial [Candidatus Zixiibacteriota bacterium]
IAAPAYCGIPCTDREKASLVTFVTGHKAQEKALSTVPWECIARARNGTVVIYMGVGEIANIVKNLIQYGMSPDSPMAVIERGTFPTQRNFTTSLKDMPDLVIRENVQPPALFVIGEVVKLQPFMEWFGHGPLFGVRVMVTRPADQANEMYRTLRELGAEVLPYPTITTKEFIDHAGWEKFDKVSGRNNWLILTSENGVRYFFKKFAERIGDIRKLADYKIAAVGYGTARALRQVHLQADFIPKKATTKALADELCEHTDMSGVNVIRIRGNLADDRIETRLTEAGASVLPVTCYETSYTPWPDGFKDRLFEHLPDVIVFTSGSTAAGLSKILSSEEINVLTKNAEVISIGPSTTGMINSLGIRTTMEADEHSIPGVIAKIVEYYTNKIQGVK